MNTSLKVYTLNFISLFMTMTNIETALKVFLLLVSIGYTIDRWWKLRADKQKQE